jgi:hypothetical protein
MTSGGPDLPAGGRLLQDPRQALPSGSWLLMCWWCRAIEYPGVCGLDSIVQAGPHGLARLPQQAIVLSRSVWVLLASLALILVASGCGGASPETRFTQTQVALNGTRTPTPLETARMVIAAGTATTLDPEIAASLTAEASLTIATPEPGNVATHMAQYANR